MERLWAAGAVVQAYDPMAMDNVRRLYGAYPSLRLCLSPAAALDDADVLVIVTEWPEFLRPDFNQIKSALRFPAIFDGRNIYDPQRVRSYDIEYFAIGIPVAEMPTRYLT